VLVCQKGFHMLAPSIKTANYHREALLRFYWGPMDCGKSTLALQMAYNHARQNRHGLILTHLDRSGEACVTSRIGLASKAVEVQPDVNLVELAISSPTPLDYLICDEVSFYSVEQINQMAELVDEHTVDVYAFGLATDFQAQLFPASQRLLEIADEVHRLQVEVLCWCGSRGLLNARVVGDAMVREGRQVLIGDTSATETEAIRYQILCRKHYRAGDLGTRNCGHST
jgi:thymidine kinase